MELTRICQHCGNEFTARTTVTKYCSHKCSQRAYKVRKRQEKIEASQTETKKQIEQSITDIQARDFLSVKQVCELLGVSRSTVWRLEKSGRVKTAKIGRKKFFTRASIDALFEVNRPTIEDEPPEGINISDCWNMGEVQQIFGVSEKALITIIERFEIPKIKKGRFAYVPKKQIVEIFGEPKERE